MTLKCTYILLLVGLFSVGMTKAGTKLDSLKAQLEQTTGLERVDLLNQISEQYLNQNTERALYYAQEALNYAQNFDDAARKAASMVNVGVVLRNIGESQEALGLFMDALKIASDARLNAIRADVLHKIGVTHLLINDMQLAKEYAEKEIKIWEAVGNDEGMASAYNFQGLIYSNLGEYAEAQKLLEQSVEMAMNLNNQDILYKPLVNLGDLYLKKAEPNKALTYIRQSIEISSLQNNKFGLTVGNLNLAEAYFQMQDYKQGENYVREALRFAEEIHSLSLVRNCYRLMAKLYEADQNYESALFYNKLYISTEDSMLSEVTKQKIAEMETRYGLELKEKEIAELKKSQRFEEIKKWFMGIAIALAATTAFVVFSFVKARQKSNEQLQFANQYKELLKQEQESMLVSMQHAGRIKRSLIPVSSSFFNIFNSYFVLEKTDNEVSSDFYWYTLKGDQLIIVQGDCAGTGINKAMNAIFCSALVGQVIGENALQTPADVVKRMHERLQAAVQNQQVGSLEEGVDISVIFLNIDTHRLLFAGAGITLYLFYNQHLQLLSPEDVKIGIPGSLQKKSFHNKTVSLRRKDKLLLLTRGFAEKQNNAGEKFGDLRLKNLLAGQADASLEEVRKALDEAFDRWKCERPDNTDALAFGLEI